MKLICLCRCWAGCDWTAIRSEEDGHTNRIRFGLIIVVFVYSNWWWSDVWIYIEIKINIRLLIDHFALFLSLISIDQSLGIDIYRFDADGFSVLLRNERNCSIVAIATLNSPMHNVWDNGGIVYENFPSAPKWGQDCIFTQSPCACAIQLYSNLWIILRFNKMGKTKINSN